MSYRQPQEMVDFQQLIKQLEHAVQHYSGKTTITDNDLHLMRFMYNSLLRYDKMAHRD